MGNNAHQFGIGLNLGIINYGRERIEGIKNSRGWSLSIVEEENDKDFQKVINRDFAGDNDSSFGVFEVAVEIVRCVDNRFCIVTIVETNATPNL